MVRWIVAALATFALGCASSSTEVVVFATTDLPVPAQLDEIVIAVTSPAGETQMARAGLGGANPPLPRTLSLVHETGPLGPFAVVVTGRLAGAAVVTRHADFTFQPGQRRRLELALLASCVGVSCAADQTCAAGGCRSRVVSASELLALNGGGEADGGASCGDTSSDPQNCGSCGNVCTVANGTAGCSGGACTVAACDDGFDDCNDEVRDGCEARLESRQHCGRCGNNCGPRMCCGGDCRMSC
ncbi:MAG: hypothetical protein KF729_37550 [Sandaracinaceae bacterium]|nr:hypothetical protein [Sandaracinaceae bacterium]